MLDIIYVLMSVYLHVDEYSLDTYYVYIIMGIGFPFCQNIPYFFHFKIVLYTYQMH